MAAALEGILVLDFTRLLPGPFATQLLCDLGADVIKVEDPSVGDYMRAVPPTVQGVPYPFAMVNRGKRSIAVDLKTPEGQEIVHRLAARADILVEQFRPAVMARLGADYATLSRINPRLLYCAFSGYGQTGPAKDRPGHDLNFEALAGILGVTGDRDRRPVIPGVPMADLASGFNAALAILAALRVRDRTGRGAFVDVSIFDTAIALMVLNLAHYLGTGEMPAPGETIVSGQWPFYNIYETKDGRWISVAAVEPKFWERLVEVLGLPELAAEQFTDVQGRQRGIAMLQQRFLTKTLEEWEDLVGKDLPCARLATLAEVVADPQLRARDMLVDVDLGPAGRRKVVGHPAHHEGVRKDRPSSVPAKGEHTDEILRSLGYSARKIAELRGQGIVGP